MLSKEQEKIVKATENKIIVNCAAASGKTACLIARINYLLDNGVNPEKIVAITFTNAAASEIKERIGERGKKCFIGTVHGYCNYLLLCGNVITSDLIESENFDELFERFLENPQCRQDVEHLLLDEGQDSTPNQIQFLLYDVDPENWIIFLDLRQILYQWNGVNPRYIINLIENPEAIKYDLNKNYRNGLYILNYAKSIIERVRYKKYMFIDNSISKSEDEGSVMKMDYDIKFIVNSIKTIDNYKDWFILTRTNAQSDFFCEELAKYNIPHETFKKADYTTTNELNQKLKNDTVKVLTIHTAKGLEANNVIVYGNKFYNDEEIRVSYVAATRARKRLYMIKDKRIKQPKIVKWE